VNPIGTIAAGRKAMKLNPALARPDWIVGQAFYSADRLIESRRSKSFANW